MPHTGLGYDDPVVADTPGLTLEPAPIDEPLGFASELMFRVCLVAPDKTYLKRLRSNLTKIGITAAVRDHNTPALFDWLMDVAAYQGISDAIAWQYMEEHGRISWREIDGDFRSGPTCPKLTSYTAFKRCNYSKSLKTCGMPEHLPACPLPSHELRKGSLNQTAYATYLFLRDVCAGDLVGWIDEQLEGPDQDDGPDRATRMRQALLGPLSGIYGLGSKVLSMAFSNLLLGASPKRERWVTTGASMIAIDTLVHNWMHRTGILWRLGAEHGYGPRCYQPGGCAEIIEWAASQIDARAFNPSFPQVFPRYVQAAIWRFCAQLGLDICNGNRIDDRHRCGNAGCPLFEPCERVALKSA